MARAEFLVQTGAKELETKLDGIAHRAGNPKPVLREIGQTIIEKGLRKQWETHGEYLGGAGSPWPKLAESTMERKSRELFGVAHADILRYSGDLEDSLTGAGKGHVLRITKNSVVVGTRDHIARFHQGGSLVSGGGSRIHRASSRQQREKAGVAHKIPARKLVGIAKHDVKPALRQLEHFLLGRNP